MPLFSRSRSRSSGSDNTAGDATATASGGASGRHEAGLASQGNGEDDRLRKETGTPSSTATSADEAVGMCGNVLQYVWGRVRIKHIAIVFDDETECGSRLNALDLFSCLVFHAMYQWL